MALFESKEEKEAKKAAKEMQKTQEFLDKYGLSEINGQDLQSIKNIASEMWGMGLMRLGMSLTGLKDEERTKIEYLSALYEQNWIIIRQLDRLNKKLDNPEK